MIRAALALCCVLTAAPALSQTSQQDGWRALANRHERQVRRVPNPASVSNPDYYRNMPIAGLGILGLCRNPAPGALRPTAAQCRAALAGSGAARP